jgi:hypothetical protein
MPNGLYLIYYLYITTAPSVRHLKLVGYNKEDLVKSLSSLRKNSTIKRTLKDNLSQIDLVEFINVIEGLHLISKRDALTIRNNL